MAERKSFLLRIDPALWSEIEAWAQAELRSVNGQIEFLLRQAVQKRKRAEPAAATEEPASGGTGEAITDENPQQGGGNSADSGGAGLDSSGPDVSLL